MVGAEDGSSTTIIETDSVHRSHLEMCYYCEFERLAYCSSMDLYYLWLIRFLFASLLFDILQVFLFFVAIGFKDSEAAVVIEVELMDCGFAWRSIHSLGLQEI